MNSFQLDGETIVKVLSQRKTDGTLSAEISPQTMFEMAKIKEPGRVVIVFQIGHFLILELQVVFLAFLWSLNISSAIKRADRAEEIVKLEHALASQVQSELDEKKQLEEGIQAIIQKMG